MPDLSHLPVRLTRPVYGYHQYQGRTNDCGPTSVAIAANALLERQAFHGPVVAEQMSHLGFERRPFPRPVLSRIPNWATFPWGMVHYLRKRGFRAQWHLFGTLERLERNLRADRISVVVVGRPWLFHGWRYVGWAHYKILFGMVPGSKLLFVDPGVDPSVEPAGLEHYGFGWQEQDEFLRQWRNLLRIFVEVDDGFGNGWR